MVNREITYQGIKFRRLHRTKIRRGTKFPFTLYAIEKGINPNHPMACLQSHVVESLEDFERLDNELNYYLKEVYYYERLYMIWREEIY